MKQYIDKSAVVAEIERQISAIDNYPKLTDTLNIQIAVLEGNKIVLTKLLSFLDTLEVKEEVYVVTRSEEHSDYVEAVFLNEDKAKKYCKTFNQDENSYARNITKVEIQ